jgi:micrococcal nuclease
VTRRVGACLAIAALVATVGCRTAETPATGEAREAREAPAGDWAAAAREVASVPPRPFCIVAAVTDGDSFRCTDDRRVRLLLLDAPEMSQRPFGTRSRDALRRVLTRGDTAWLEFDVQREDRYGRTLAHVWTAAVGGTHVNLQQAREGWAVAVVFPPNVRHIDAVRAAVADARRARRGLWADGTFTCEPIAHKRGDC